MEWILLVTLFSTSDVLLAEQSSYKECVSAVKKFEKEHRHDKDIKSVQCARGIIVQSDDEIFAGVK